MSTEEPRRRFRLPAPPLWLIGLFEAVQALLVMTLLVGVPVGAGLVAQQWGNVEVAAVLAVIGQVWLVIHAVPLQVGDADSLFSLVPMGLTLIPLVLAWRVGQRLARGAYPNQLWQGLAPYAVAYIGGAVTLAWFGQDSTVQISLWWAGLCAGLVVVLGSVSGCLAEARSISRLFGMDLQARIQELSQRLKWTGAYLWAVLRGAVVASVTAVALAAALLGGQLAWRWMDVVNSYQELQVGLIGALALTLVHMALLPNLVLWTLAYSTGAGFWVGTDAHLTPWAAELGAVPEVPVLAALPAGYYEYWWAVFAVPLVAGILAGWWLMREGENHMDDWFALHLRPRVVAATLSTLVLGALTGLVTALITLLPLWLSHISLGLGRMTDIGPHALVSAGMLGAWVAVGTILGYGLTIGLRPVTRPRRRAEKA